MDYRIKTSLKNQNFILSLWLILICIMAALPGFFSAPISINTFDEPYQIMNAYDFHNAVYSPLSGILGHWVGSIFGWEYLVFRRLLIVLLVVSIYIASQFALVNCSHKRLILTFAFFCTLFATVFKSDMNIYGWDHWSAVAVVVNMVLLLSILKRWNLNKIIWLGLVSGICVLLRLPNIAIVLFSVILLGLIGRRRFGGSRLALYLIIYCLVAGAASVLILCVSYGSISNYLLTFNDNPVGAHSLGRLLKPLSISVLSLLRYTAIMLLGYLVIWFACNRCKRLWIKALLISLMTICYFLLLIPLRRNVLGNVIETPICFALSGLLLLFVRGYKNRQRREILYALTILLMGSVIIAGSNWGAFKFLAWPSIPLIVMGVARKWTKSIKWYSISVGISMFAYIFYGYFRPTFDDREYNKLTYKLNEGVFKGMYTNPSRGAQMDETLKAVKPYQKAGYEIIPIRLKNEYLWEYMFMWRNGYQRHQFDNWDAYNDPAYVEWILDRMESDDGKRKLLLYIYDDKTPSNLMFETLSHNFIKVGSGSRFILFTKEK